MPSRRRAREQALQILYLIDLSGLSEAEALRTFETNFAEDSEDRDFVASLVEGVAKHREEIDRVLESHAENWRISRMPRIDRNILRLGTFELVHTDTPGPVILDEAVELAKRFGEERTGAFVNGILDRVFRERAKGV